VNPLDDFVSAAAGSRGLGLFSLCDGILWPPPGGQHRDGLADCGLPGSWIFRHV